MDLPKQLTSQLKGMERLVDGQTGSILFRHPELRGIPNLVVEGDGYTIRADSKCVPIALACSSSLRCP